MPDLNQISPLEKVKDAALESYQQGVKLLVDRVFRDETADIITKKRIVDIIVANVVEIEQLMQNGQLDLRVIEKVLTLQKPQKAVEAAFSEVQVVAVEEEVVADEEEAVADEEEVVADEEEAVADEEEVVADEEEVVADEEEAVADEEEAVAVEEEVEEPALQKMKRVLDNPEVSVKDFRQFLADFYNNYFEGNYTDLSNAVISATGDVSVIPEIVRHYVLSQGEKIKWTDRQKSILNWLRGAIDNIINS